MSSAKKKKGTKNASSISNIIDIIIDNLTDYVLVLDNDGCIIAINQATYDFLGYEKEELINKSSELIFSNTLFLEGAEFESLIKDGIPYQHEVDCIRRDGEFVTLIFSGKLLSDEEEEFLGVIAILTDKTRSDSLADDYRRVLKAERMKSIELEKSQNAVLNIVDDLEARNRELEESQAAFLNLMLDLEAAYSSLEESSEREKQLAAVTAAAEVEEKRAADLEKAYNELKETSAQLVQSEKLLLQAQKLESVGQLAAGIAHEINTPIQFVGDNICFLKESFNDLMKLISLFQKIRGQYEQSSIISNDKISELDEIINQIDLVYLAEEIPKAIEQSGEGIKRVSDIVRAMKAFSHPDGDEKNSVNINKTIENAATVSRNEWKYAADLKIEFSETMPPVECYQGGLNQVILNIIVNAAHAIEEKNGKNSGKKGLISISTGHDDKWAIIRISDTGGGIPEKYHSRIFDPFFTTKDVGKGTGQGLFLAYNAVVRQHRGTITFNTETGVGTTFTIKLPLGDEV